MVRRSFFRAPIATRPTRVVGFESFDSEHGVDAISNAITDKGKGTPMTSEWYAQLMGDVVGPLSPNELRRMVRDRKLLPSDLVRKGNDGRWVDASQVTGLFDHLAPQSAPVVIGRSPPPIAASVHAVAPVAVPVRIPQLPTVPLATAPVRATMPLMRSKWPALIGVCLASVMLVLLAGFAFTRGPSYKDALDLYNAESEGLAVIAKKHDACVREMKEAKEVARSVATAAGYRLSADILSLKADTMQRVQDIEGRKSKYMRERKRLLTTAGELSLRLKKLEYKEAVGEYFDPSRKTEILEDQEKATAALKLAENECDKIDMEAQEARRPEDNRIAEIKSKVANLIKKCADNGANLEGFRVDEIADNIKSEIENDGKPENAVKALESLAIEASVAKAAKDFDGRLAAIEREMADQQKVVDAAKKRKDELSTK